MEGDLRLRTPWGYNVLGRGFCVSIFFIVTLKGHLLDGVILLLLFLKKCTVKDHISNTKLEKDDHYYIQTRHKDLFSHYNLILRKL